LQYHLLTGGELMGTFQVNHTDIRDPGWQPGVMAELGERGLVAFTGITGHTELVALARQLMTVRPHRDAGPDGITVITSTRAEDPGYAGFTDAELIPHTDGSGVPDPPGLLLLACQRPADEGGNMRVVDGASIMGTLAEQHPAALHALSAPRAAFFGATGGHLSAVLEPAGPGRTRIPSVRPDRRRQWPCPRAVAAESLGADEGDAFTADAPAITRRHDRRKRRRSPSSAEL
jgi:hypothetical protein